MIGLNGTTAPRITVAMCVFNGAQYLQEAIDSILNQTETDFEFLILDDGSTDETPSILAGQTDSRIRVLASDTNQGLAAGLNRILSEARGHYIARMDADDISLPGRFQLQADFLDSHPDIALLGTAFTLFESATGEDFKIMRRPERPGEVSVLLGIASQVCHPAAMFRREFALAVGGYRPKMGIAEDYDFWLRLRERFRLANLDNVLYRVRWHDRRVSNARLNQQIAYSRLALMLAYERRLLGEDSLELLTPEEIEAMFDGGIPEPRRGSPTERARVIREWKRIGYWHDPRAPEKGLIKRLGRWPLDFEAWLTLAVLTRVQLRWKLAPVRYLTPSGKCLKR